MDRMEDDAEQGTRSGVVVMETVALFGTICVALVIGWRIDKKLQDRHTKRGGRHRR